MTEMIILAVVVLVLLLVIACANQKTGGTYGYVTLPDGEIIEGWVEHYKIDGANMATVRLKGITYYVPCSKITLIKK